MYLNFFSLELLREKFENILQISGKTQGKLRETQGKLRENSGKTQGNSGNLVSQNCGRPVNVSLLSRMIKLRMSLAKVA